MRCGVLGGLILGVVAVALAVAGDMEARVRSRCFHCHGGEKLCVAGADVTWWEHAIARMLFYEEGLLEREEIAPMAAWLARDEHRRPWCPQP